MMCLLPFDLMSTNNKMPLTCHLMNIITYSVRVLVIKDISGNIKVKKFTFNNGRAALVLTVLAFFRK